MSVMKEKAIIEVLKFNMIGHLALSVNNTPYVIPVCYSYINDNLYFILTSPGKKIDALKTNPQVCFVVDEWEEDGSWRSVIVYGVAKLFHDTELSLKILENFVGTLKLEAFLDMAEEPPSEEGISELDLFVCEVQIEKITGRASTTLLER